MPDFSRIFFLLSTVSLALSSPTGLIGFKAASTLAKAGILTTRDDNDYPWAAIGDSFSAGPGAGNPVDDEPDQCFRNDGAYPPQLNKDFPFPNSAMQFLSCTGDVVNDMIATQLPHIDEDQQVVTLSIGGNDLGFARVLRACVFKPGGPFSEDCDTVIGDVRTYLQNGMEDTLSKAYDAVFGKITDDYHRKVFVQLYPNFFNADTNWCNDQTMGIVPGYKPLLDQDLRGKLNSLGDAVRDEMKGIIERYVARQPHWFQNRMFYMDEFDHDIYPSHRFCDQGFETLDDPNIWFFTIGGNDSPSVTAEALLAQYDAATCAGDPNYNTSFLFGWNCDSARYVTTLGNNTSDFVTFAPESVVKAFHPKTIAFTAIKDQHKDAISRLAWPRQTNINQGNLQCRRAQKDGDPEFYASRDDMVTAMDQFCQSTASAGVNPGLVEGVYNGQTVSATMDDKPTGCPPLDVTSAGFQDLCTSRLINAIDGCDVQPRTSDLWKQGGAFYRDCVTWYIGRQPYLSTLSVSAANSTGV